MESVSYIQLDSAVPVWNIEVAGPHDYIAGGWLVHNCASFRNSSTDRFKALSRVVKNKEWVWGLTGTPTPNAPTDAWAQVKLVSPTRVPNYFSAFRSQVMYQASKFKWLPRDGALEVVRAAMQPAIRFSREECIDLPPTTIATRSVALTPEQTKAYRTMLTRMKAEVGDKQIVAVNEAAKLTKLLQIVTGTAYSDDGEVVIPSHHRVELVKEIIEEAGAKVIVFVPFTGVLRALEEALSTEYSTAVISGSVSKSDRDRIFADFQNSKEPRVLLAIAAAMSHGLTLTAADTIVWFAPINSLEIYEQACARIVRPGQTRNTLIVNIEGSELEQKMYNRLQHKGKMQGLLLELLKGV